MREKLLWCMLCIAVFLFVPSGKLLCAEVSANWIYGPVRMGENAQAILDDQGNFYVCGDGVIADYNDEEGTRWTGYYPWRRLSDGTAVADHVKRIVFLGDFTTIGHASFDSLRLIETVELPSGLVEIGSHAFSCCGINRIEFPTSLRTLGGWAFADNAFETLLIPDTIEKVEKGAFARNESLRFVKVEAPLERIEDYTFDDCKNLSVIVLPDSVKELGKKPFGYYYERWYAPGRGWEAERKKCENLTVYGLPGSVVEAYAIENGFEFRDSATFQPPKKLAKSEGLVFSLSQTAYNYANKAWRPVVTIKDGDYTLVQGVDYTVTYENNTEVGTARVTVTGLDSYNDGRCYTGSKYFSYKIIPRGTTITKLTAATKGFDATIKKQATQTTGYQLRYSTSEDMNGAKTVTIADNTICRKQITKLKAKQKYYVQVRTYTIKDGKKYYSAWSQAKMVVTK